MKILHKSYSDVNSFLRKEDDDNLKIRYSFVLLRIAIANSAVRRVFSFLPTIYARFTDLLLNQSKH